MLFRNFSYVLVVSLLLISYCPHVWTSYGTLEIAIYLRVPSCPDISSLLQAVHDQEASLKTKILITEIEQKKRHMTFTYPFIPLDEQVIKLFPRIQCLVDKLPINKQAQAYKKKIPRALSKWLTPKVRRLFRLSQKWDNPVLLPFLKLQKLGKFLTAEFSLDEQGRLLQIVDAIKKGLKEKFQRVRFAFDTMISHIMIPHISLGIINPLFNVAHLVQPGLPIAPLAISKASSKEIVVSVRMNRMKKKLPSKLVDNGCIEVFAGLPATRYS